ncbi:hypothetical protein C8R46DRAFT_1033682 [Mycena filopes]|nr:hypothetical protein C8R46DRAFT_1033682 [Mycena filopes]
MKRRRGRDRPARAHTGARSPQRPLTPIAHSTRSNRALSGPNEPLGHDHGGTTARGTGSDPFLVDENGQFVTNFGRVMQIFGGPPSLIRSKSPGRSRTARDQVNDGPYRQLATVSHGPSLSASTSTASTISISTSDTSASTCSTSRASTSTRTLTSASVVDSGLAELARGQLPRVRFSGAPTSRPRPVVRVPMRIIRRDPSRYEGSRSERDTDLTADDLYLTATRPPSDDKNPHYQPADGKYTCGICLGIKSHPVVYACNHSDCYVCIRQWLESSWQCPHCRAVMHTPPAPVSQEFALEIQLAHLEWHDTSLVTGTWDGLRFPVARPDLSTP